MLTVGVSAIGLKSFSIELGGFTLGIGTMLACFHVDGKMHCLSDVLNILHRDINIVQFIEYLLWVNDIVVRKFPRGDVCDRIERHEVV